MCSPASAIHTRKYCHKCHNTCKFWSNSEEVFCKIDKKLQGPRSRLGSRGLSPGIFSDLLNGSFFQIAQKCNKKSLKKMVPPLAPAHFLRLRGPWKIASIASKLTSIVSILASIALAGEHIFQLLAQYSWVLPQYLQVLSRWIHPIS